MFTLVTMKPMRLPSELALADLMFINWGTCCETVLLNNNTGSLYKGRGKERGEEGRKERGRKSEEDKE